MPTATLEELSNQRRSKKISNGAETKETELDVLQRQRNKGTKDWDSGGRGIALLKPLVKDKLLTPEKYPWTRKNGSWNPQGEGKITAEKYTRDVMWHNKCSWYLMKGFIPSVTILSDYVLIILINMVFNCSLRLAPRCLASALVSKVVAISHVERPRTALTGSLTVYRHHVPVIVSAYLCLLSIIGTRTLCTNCTVHPYFRKFSFISGYCIGTWHIVPCLWCIINFSLHIEW